MADAYRAEDERLKREVALRALLPKFASDGERVEPFEREVRAAVRKPGRKAAGSPFDHRADGALTYAHGP